MSTVTVSAQLAEVIERAWAEDLAQGPDLTTTACVPAAAQGLARIVTREAGVLAGIDVARAALAGFADRTGVQVHVRTLTRDGARVVPGECVAEVSGSLRAILTAERTALNLLGQLSGVATLTAAWVDAVAGSGVVIRDTRKTVPGMRALQKYAVRCGGGQNHRQALGDAALIKDNHIAAAGSVRAAFMAVRTHAPQIAVEVECDDLDQVVEAIDAGARLLLLDNMDDDQLAAAVALARPAGVHTEASGGLSLDRAARVARTGVDFIAVGALTHSAPVLDFGLDVETS